MSNFTQQLLDLGFKEVIRQRLRDVTGKSVPDFSPKDNWMGVSVYHPDAIFERGETKVIISAQGLYSMDRLTSETAFKYKILFETGSVRYIYIEKCGKCIYETYSGEIPPLSLL